MVTMWQTTIENESMEYQEVELKQKDAPGFVLRLLPTFRGKFPYSCFQFLKQVYRICSFSSKVLEMSIN